MPANSGAITGTIAHVHSAPSAEGGFLLANSTGMTGTNTGSLIYFDGSSVAQDIPAGALGSTLTMGASVPAWGGGGSVGSWIEIASADNVDSIDVGGAASTLFDDFKYIRMICDYKQSNSNYTEFQFYDSGGVVINNDVLFQWGEPTMYNPNLYSTQAQCRIGYAESGNVVFHDLLWQINTSGTHQ